MKSQPNGPLSGPGRPSGAAADRAGRRAGPAGSRSAGRGPRRTGARPGHHRDGTPLADILRTGRVPVRVESAIVGKRALPADGFTIAGYLDERQAVYAAATHSGVTLGPLLGRLVAEEILDGRSAELLTAFRPGRFGADGRAFTPVGKLLEQGGD